MQTSLRKLVVATGLTTGMAFSTGASADFMSFFVDADGDLDTSNATAVDEWIDINSSISVNNTYTGATSFTFTQSGNAFSTTADADPTKNLFNDIQATLSGSGTGTLGGGLNFNSGLIEVFSGATSIAQFNIVDGSGLVTSEGAPNGQTTLVAQAQYFAPGYFYLDNGGSVGDDLSTLDLNTGVDGDEEGELLFGYTTTNLSIEQGTAVNDDGGRLLFFEAGGNGQFRLEQVPAPATLLLFGLGLIGVGATARRRAAA